MFRALVLNQDADGGVTVDVEFSTVNYKDSLAICNGAPVVRTWPMVPGIDFAGAVSASTHPDFAPGQPVVLNGWGVGEQVPDVAARMLQGAVRGRIVVDVGSAG